MLGFIVRFFYAADFIFNTKIRYLKDVRINISFLVVAAAYMHVNNVFIEFKFYLNPFVIYIFAGAIFQITWMYNSICPPIMTFSFTCFILFRLEWIISEMKQGYFFFPDLILSLTVHQLFANGNIATCFTKKKN